MSTPPSAFPGAEPIWLRLLRGCVALALALAVTVIVALIIVGCVPSVQAAFRPLFDAESKMPRGPVAAAMVFFILVPVLLLFWPLMRRALLGTRPAPVPWVPGRERRGRFRWLNWISLAIGWVIVLPILIWLSWDESTVRENVSIEEFSPAFPGADKSNALLLQYSTQNPGPEAKALAAAQMLVPGFGITPADKATWLEFVAANRAGLEADWATLAPQRHWLDELNHFERIGDLTPPDLNADIVKFQPWRALSYHACGMATIQALDGHGDEAIATLLPLLEVSRKLQLTSRTLLRCIVAEVSERMTMETALIVLDHAKVSVATRERLDALLANGNPGVQARRMIMTDFVQYAPVYFTMKIGDAFAPTTGFVSLLRRPLNFISSLLLNPNATLNLYGDHVRELAALAEARDLDAFYRRTKAFNDNVLLKPGVKNLGGRMLINLAIPSYDRVLESHWKTADIREALRKRLAEKS